jgi:hypothetical protein
MTGALLLLAGLALVALVELTNEIVPGPLSRIRVIFVNGCLVGAAVMIGLGLEKFARLAWGWLA